MNNNILSYSEILILVCLIFVIFFPLKLFNKFNILSLTNPLIVNNLIISYYAILSPIYMIFNNQTTYRGLEFRDTFLIGWIGALISIISTSFGYFFVPYKRIRKYRICNLNSSQLWNIGLVINIVSFIIYGFANGFDISKLNPLINQSYNFEFLKFTGSFRNYFSLTQDCLITGTFLMFTSFLKNKKRGVITFFNLIIVLGLYINTGFRYKLLFLTLPIFLFFLINKKFNLKSKILVGFGSLTLFIFSNYTLSLARTYGQGLNLKELSNFNFSYILKSFFISSDSSVFLATSGLMSIVPSKVSFVYFYPIYKLLIHPIPSTIFSGKDPGDYLQNTMQAVFGSQANAFGSAIHNYGEYYLMFGWIGIIIGNFIFGFILKKLWIWILIHKDEEIAIPLYLLNISFIYMVISRGYLSQQLQIYVFSILPIVLIYIIFSKRIKSKLIK